MKTVEKLIEDMKTVKEDNPTLELSDILRIFNINVLINLTNEIRKMRIK